MMCLSIQNLKQQTSGMYQIMAQMTMIVTHNTHPVQTYRQFWTEQKIMLISMLLLIYCQWTWPRAMFGWEIVTEQPVLWKALYPTYFKVQTTVILKLLFQVNFMIIIFENNHKHYSKFYDTLETVQNEEDIIFSKYVY